MKKYFLVLMVVLGTISAEAQLASSTMGTTDHGIGRCHLDLGQIRDFNTATVVLKDGESTVTVELSFTDYRDGSVLRILRDGLSGPWVLVKPTHDRFTGANDDRGVQGGLALFRGRISDKVYPLSEAQARHLLTGVEWQAGK